MDGWGLSWQPVGGVLRASERDEAAAQIRWWQRADVRRHTGLAVCDGGESGHGGEVKWFRGKGVGMEAGLSYGIIVWYGIYRTCNAREVGCAGSGQDRETTGQRAKQETGERERGFESRMDGWMGGCMDC